jgi:hypothetical protein
MQRECHCRAAIARAAPYNGCMSRYIHAMTRDELVAEIRDFILWGVADDHEIPDPTILPPRRLRPMLAALRVRALQYMPPTGPGAASNS